MEHAGIKLKPFLKNILVFDNTFIIWTSAKVASKRNQFWLQWLRAEQKKINGYNIKINVDRLKHVKIKVEKTDCQLRMYMYCYKLALNLCVFLLNNNNSANIYTG